MFIMISLNDGIFCKTQLISFNVILLLLAVHSQMLQPSSTIVALLGEDVILPCHLEPAMDAVSETVEWGRPDLEPRFVHLWHGGKDHFVNQNPSYKERTSVSIDKLKQGDLSLQLSAVKLSDSGVYRCYFPSKDQKTNVKLVVGSVSSPFITGINVDSSAVELQCNSTGWYPEPEVFWLDGEGNLLSAGPPETVRGPDDLYTVSSRVTVEKRHSNSFTCRVTQKKTNQTRKTVIQVKAQTTYCSAHIAVIVVMVLIVIAAAAFVVWKWKQMKDAKTQQDQAEHTERKKLMAKAEMTEDLKERIGKHEELQRRDEELQRRDEELQKRERQQKDFEELVCSKQKKLKEDIEHTKKQSEDMHKNYKDIDMRMKSVEKMTEKQQVIELKGIAQTAKNLLLARKQENEAVNMKTQGILNIINDLLDKMPDRQKEEPQVET